MLKNASRSRKPENQLTQEHTEFILSLVTSQATLTVKSIIHQVLKGRFHDFSVSESKVYTHMQRKYRLSFKRIVKIIQNTDVIVERCSWVAAWAGLGNAFINRRIFIDEAGFNMHTLRRVGWSREGKREQNNKDKNYTVIGAICARGIINMMIVLPKAASTSKKRKLKTNLTAPRGLEKERKGTTAKHFQEGYTLVMDNAPIHNGVVNLIESRG
ncbi:hypothetical protein DFQ26_006580, partial [Actinomortierella ambigua]